MLDQSFADENIDIPASNYNHQTATAGERLAHYKAVHAAFVPVTFTVELQTLCTALAGMSKVLEKRNTIPILGNVLFAGDGTLHGTDLDMHLMYKLGPDVQPHPAFTVNLAELQAALRGADKGALVWLTWAGPDSLGKSLPLTLNVGGLTCKLGTLPEEDFPGVVQQKFTKGLEGAHEFILPAANVRSLLAFSGSAVSTEKTRYYLNGVYLHSANDNLRCVATDGYRLAMIESGAGWAVKDAGVIVPSKTVQTAIALIGKKPAGGVELKVGYNKVQFRTLQWTLISKVIDGTFPEYTRSIPSRAVMQADVDCKQLLAAVTRLAAQKDQGPIVLDPVAGTIRNRAGTIPVTFTNMDIRTGKDPMTDKDYLNFAAIGINGRYLKEAAQTMLDAGAVTLRFCSMSAGDPIRVEAVGNTDLLMVIMPMSFPA